MNGNAPLFKLLFVCMGNICRSPAAEGIMRSKIVEAGLQDHVHIHSAGTGGWHSGSLPDQRMRAAASTRGYALESLARQVTTQDLAEANLVLVMDSENQRDLRSFDREQLHAAKVRLFCEFCTRHTTPHVPDPYYGGAQGFENVLDLLEDGCESLLLHIRQHVDSKPTA